MIRYKIIAILYFCSNGVEINLHYCLRARYNTRYQFRIDLGLRKLDYEY